MTGLALPTYDEFQAAAWNEWTPSSPNKRRRYADPQTTTGERLASTFSSNTQFPTVEVSAKAKARGKRREQDYIRQQAEETAETPFSGIGQSESQWAKTISQKRWSRASDLRDGPRQGAASSGSQTAGSGSADIPAAPSYTPPPTGTSADMAECSEDYRDGTENTGATPEQTDSCRGGNHGRRGDAGREDGGWSHGGGGNYA